MHVVTPQETSARFSINPARSHLNLSLHHERNMLPAATLCHFLIPWCLIPSVCVLCSTPIDMYNIFTELRKGGGQ